MKKNTIQPRRALGYRPGVGAATWWRRTSISLAVAGVTFTGIGATAAQAATVTPEQGATQYGQVDDSYQEPVTTDQAAAPVAQESTSSAQSTTGQAAPTPQPAAASSTQPKSSATETSKASTSKSTDSKTSATADTKASSTTKAKTAAGSATTNAKSQAAVKDTSSAKTSTKRSAKNTQDCDQAGAKSGATSSSSSSGTNQRTSSGSTSGSSSSWRNTSTNYTAATTSSTASTAAARQTTQDGAALPLASGTFQTSAQFGATGSWARYHTGLDFSAAGGTPVYAVVDGTVVSSSAGSWAGTHVVIEAADGSHTLYAHLSSASVSPGTKVTAGQQIGAVGQTGRAFGNHLHFEYYQPGTTPGDVYSASDPADYLRSLGLSI